MAANSYKKGISRATDNGSNEQIKYICYKCGATSINDRFSNIVRNDLFKGMNYRIPICKNCLSKLYLDYLRNTCEGDEYRAIQRICVMYDIYYNDEIVDMARNYKSESMIMNYFKALNTVKFMEHRGKTYSDTIIENNNKDDIPDETMPDSEIPESVKKFFGHGFSDRDYAYLQEQYEDWTTRHECETKSQEEMFKQLCFTQLQLLEAQRAKTDTKDLSATFLKQLEVAKLQPKQNDSESNSNSQTFGTLIDKWENTRPIPEVDEDLKDVDGIGLYLDVFFRGHLAKMMGMNKALSNLYTKFMEKYTVKKPEYDEDEDSEALFDAIFGNYDNEDI